MLLPSPSDARTFSGCCISFPFQCFLSFLLFVCCCPCFSLRFVAHAGVQVKHEDWHSWWNIFYVYFLEGTGGKKKGAINQPQWVHIPLLYVFLRLVFYLYCCFFVAAFMLSAEAQRLIPRTHGEGKEPWPTICLDNLSMLIR